MFALLVAVFGTAIWLQQTTRPSKVMAITPPLPVSRPKQTAEPVFDPSKGLYTDEKLREIARQNREREEAAELQTLRAPQATPASTDRQRDLSLARAAIETDLALPNSRLTLPYSILSLLPRGGELVGEERAKASDGTPRFISCWIVDRNYLGVICQGAESAPNCVTLMVPENAPEAAKFLLAFGIKATESDDVQGMANWLRDNCADAFSGARSCEVGDKQLVLIGAKLPERVLMLTVARR